MKCEIQRLLKERAVLLNETKKQNQTLQEKKRTVEEQYERIVGEKTILIEKVFVFATEKDYSWYIPSASSIFLQCRVIME